MPIKFLVGGGVFEFFLGGWSARFYLYGREAFSE